MNRAASPVFTRDRFPGDIALHVVRHAANLPVLKIGGPPGSLTPLSAFVALRIVRYTSSPKPSTRSRVAVSRRAICKCSFKRQMTNWSTHSDSNRGHRGRSPGSCSLNDRCIKLVPHEGFEPPPNEGMVSKTIASAVPPAGHRKFLPKFL